MNEPSPNRRAVTAGLLGLAVGACGGGGARIASAPPAPAQPPTTPSPAPTPTGSINQAARSRGLRFGSAFSWNQPGADAASFANPNYAALLERDCGILVPENEMKWQAIRPAADTYNFTRFDAMMAYADAKGIPVRGHTLLWHRPRWFPTWLNNYDFGARPAAEGERILVEHIRTVMRRYGGRIASYDVVNEAVDPDTSGLVDTSLSKALGGVEATLDLAFRTARAEGPTTELVYNDYMSWEPGNERHRAGVLRLLEGFKARGTPVDALGIQSHIEIRSIDPATGTGPYQEREWRAFLDAVVAMGYKLVITELDVKCNALPSDIAVRDAGVARYLKAYMDVMLEYPQLRDVLAWGMCDRYSWLQGFSPRADGLPLRCCPYDGNFQPKPMRDTLIAGFSAARAR